MPTITPHATYRVQLRQAFGFRELLSLLPYIKQLHLSHVYLSPCLRARGGSKHGYDITNHNELNPELGTREDFSQLVREAKQNGIGFIFDMVPNHMGILGNSNRWWSDVLENGPASAYAKFFDIEWYSSLKPELHEKVLLPILGCAYGEALESGQLQLLYQQGRIELQYYEHRFPIDPGTLDNFFVEGMTDADSSAEEWHEYESIITAIRNLPKRSETQPERMKERAREKEVIQRRIAALVEASVSVRAAIGRTIEKFNGERGKSESFNSLDELLNIQAFRLSSFQVAADEINYRRFFDINELAALSTERTEVFEDTHKLLFELLEEGALDGVRIDHVDGLYDPRAYLNALQVAYRDHTSEEEPLYLVVEKILDAEERLPEDWPVNGTTGYDFLSLVNGVFIDTANEKALNRIYSRWSDGSPPFGEVAYRCKQQIQNLTLSAELHVLAQRLDRLSELDRHSRDFTLAALLNALRDVISCFPVYRSYADDEGLSERDIQYIEHAIACARGKNPVVHSSLFDFIRNTLLLHPPHGASEGYSDLQLQFVRKFQQVTSPVAAKGVEDTAFYLYNRLLSLNEVGSNPDLFGIPLKQFHQRMQERWKRQNASLSATATHDTKRGEDTRARLNVLSEIPREFSNALLRFERINRDFRRDVAGKLVPERNTLYLFYQTLIGAWPLGFSPEALPAFRERIQAYMQKAIHEAKQSTSWVNPNIEYEEAMRSYVEHVLSPENAPFLAEMEKFMPRIIHCGLLNSLSQLVLKLMCPGVPDFYQGTELWDLSLVDPDNRRRVDFQVRAKILEELSRRKGEPGFVEDLRNDLQSGRIKMFTIAQALELRQAHAGLFANGKYEALEATADRKNHLVAFRRSDGVTTCIVVVPRFLTNLLPAPDVFPFGETVWHDAHIAVKNTRGMFRNIFTDESLYVNGHVRVAEVLQTFPVAVLISEYS